MVASKAIELMHVLMTKQHADFFNRTLLGDGFRRHFVAIMHACSIGKRFDVQERLGIIILSLLSDFEVILSSTVSGFW